MSLVILDRDGVINHDSDQYIKSAEEWQPIHGSLEAIAELHRFGYVICIATNQAGIGRGVFPAQALEEIHSRMNRLVADAGGLISHIFYCPHHPDDQCTCRKPKPGLLLQACQTLNALPTGVPFVGDSITDIEAAEAAGCQPVLVRTGNGAGTVTHLGERKIPIFDDLESFSNALIQGRLLSGL
jgi:D-glycero-D-manno-heptose 1,7-bisphosphate phosphatase